MQLSGYYYAFNFEISDDRSCEGNVLSDLKFIKVNSNFKLI